MPFDKVIPSKIAEYKIFDVASTEELVKIASDVDFPEGFVYDPDFMYMWVRIVSAGEYYGPNKNGDYFPEDELIEYWETFNEAHPFKNHENKNVENAIGKIIFVRWNPLMKCVELLKGIDRKRAPEIVRGYLKGYLTDVSMGCKVPYTVCSICGNKARRRSEFCDHVKYHRLQFLDNGERVYEINYKPKFHDSSTVLNGAERVAKAFYLIDSPPKGTTVSSFKKVASTNGTMHFVQCTKDELEKIAKFQSEIHPLLQEEQTEKIATKSPMLKKIAELEKEITGKLLNICSSVDGEKLSSVEQMLEVIKFLTEKRIDEDSLKNIASSLKEISQENDVPLSKAFATLIGVAELMGIEFFPNELHTLLRELTDARLNEDLETSPSGDESVFPSDFAKGIKKAVKDIGKVKDFNDPSSVLKLYDETAHFSDDFSKNPLSFLSNIMDGNEMSSRPSVHMIKVVKKTLKPLMSLRSSHPEHLYPRLAVIISGHNPIVGGPNVRKDLEVLMNPSSIGDLLAKTAYTVYENMRPKLKESTLSKTASDVIEGVEKTAFVPVNKGIIPEKFGLGYGQLALMAIPSAYVASSFQKNRREHGRYLSDGENFVADHPGIVAGGAIVGGKPLSEAISKTMKNPNVINALDQAKFKLKSNFRKFANERFEGLVKVADSFSSGDFNVFSDKKASAYYMSETGASSEQTSALKMATLLSVGGMEKEAFEILDHYNIPFEEKGRFLKAASLNMEEAIEKAAGEFINNMLLSTVGDTTPLARTLPGRAVDAMIFKKITEMMTPEEDENQINMQENLPNIKTH